jgi:hypothetical protein
LDVFPDYSSINSTLNSASSYDNNSIIGSNDDDDPNITVLVTNIADYYMALCENQQKAQIYQNLINLGVKNVSSEIYEQTVADYYREYGRILNISLGILASMMLLYKL